MSLPGAVLDPKCGFNLLTVAAMTVSGASVLFTTLGVQVLRPASVVVKKGGVLVEGVRKGGHFMLPSAPSLQPSVPPAVPPAVLPVGGGWAYNGRKLAHVGAGEGADELLSPRAGAVVGAGKGADELLSPRAGVGGVVAAPTSVLPASDSLSAVQLWHSRLGHPSLRAMEQLVRHGMVVGLPLSLDAVRAAAGWECEPCAFGKSYEHIAGSMRLQGEPEATAPGELLHADLFGVGVAAHDGSKYMLVVVDDFSGMIYVDFAVRKYEVPAQLLFIIGHVESVTKRKVVALRSDRGSEFLASELQSEMKRRGIIFTPSCTYSPWQNGVAERAQRSIWEAAHSMLYDCAGLEENLRRLLWAEAAAAATVLRNRLPSKGKGNKTPYELLNGVKPRVDGMRRFGCTAYVHVPRALRRKTEPKARRGIMVGYVALSGYRIYVDGRIVESCSVRFFEDSMGVIGSIAPPLAPGRGDGGEEDAGDDDGAVLSETEEPGGETSPPGSPEPAVPPAAGLPGGGAGGTSLPPGAQPPAAGAAGGMGGEQHQHQQQQQRRSSRSTRGVPPVRLHDILAAATCIKDPASLEEALQRDDRVSWEAAMLSEYTSLLDNETWDLVPRGSIPPGSKVLKGRWVFKDKGAHAPSRYKARWTAKGCMQVQGRDFEDSFAPGSNAAATRIFLSIVAAENLEMTHIDISSAFLNGWCKEEVYVEQPHMFETGDGMVCKLHKSLYGLRQAPRAWYERLKGELSSLGFEPLEGEPSLYMWRDGDNYSLIDVHVDDMLIATSSSADTAFILEGLGQLFKYRKVGGGNSYCFIGQEIERDRSNRSINITQQRYIGDLAQRFGQIGTKGKQLPLAPGTIISKAEEGEELLDTARYPYNELVGCLLYVSVCTRPDISFAVNRLARYMQAPTPRHWKQAINVLRYLISTKNEGLHFGGGSMEPLVYCDADFYGDPDCYETNILVTSCSFSFSLGR